MQPEQPLNTQRALWTFLSVMLIGPFFAALAILIAVGLAGPFGLQPLLPEGLPNAGWAAVITFVWSGLPAAVAAMVILPVVIYRGTFGMLVAAGAGVLGLFVAVLFSNMPYREYLPAMAFLAALIALGVRYALLAGGILKVEETK